MKRKAKKVFIIISFALYLILQFNIATGLENESDNTKNMEIIFNLPENGILTANQTYQNIIKIENLDHKTGEQNELDLTLTNKLNNITIHESNHTINKFTSSATGNITLQTNVSKTLCSYLNSTNFVNSGTTQKCIELTTIKNEDENDKGDEENETSKCNCPLKLELDKPITKNNVKIDIEHCLNSSSTYANPIEYWVENLDEEIVKSLRTTTNTASKTYTPNTNFPQESFLVKANVEACNVQTSQLFTKINDDEETIKEKQETFFNLTTPAQSDKTIIPIVIEGYKDTNHRIIKAYVNKDGNRVSEISKIEIRNDNFFMEIPLALKEIETGMHNIIVEGIGKTLIERIYIQGPPEEIPPPIKPKITSINQKGIYLTDNATLEITFEDTYSSTLQIQTSAENKTLIITQNTIETQIKLNHPKEIALLKLYDETGNLIEQKYHKFNYIAINEKDTSKNTDDFEENENETSKQINNTLLIAVSAITLLLIIIYLDVKNK